MDEKDLQRLAVSLMRTTTERVKKRNEAGAISGQRCKLAEYNSQLLEIAQMMLWIDSLTPPTANRFGFLLGEMRSLLEKEMWQAKIKGGFR